MPRFHLLAAFCCVALFASGSIVRAADDGTVLINPNGVLEGGSCHGQGFPIKICAAGHYKLTGNISVGPHTDGIDIFAADVTIDLNGFSINGPGTCTATAAPTCSGDDVGSGIFSANDNITVRNGSTNGFVIGVQLVGHGSLVEDVHAKNNQADGLHVWYGIVRHSTAVQNRVSGIFMKAGVLENNYAEFNYFGLFGERMTVLGNTTTNNNYGLDVTQGSVYGSNSFTIDAIADVFSSGAISQGNNVCGTGSC